MTSEQPSGQAFIRSFKTVLLRAQPNQLPQRLHVPSIVGYLEPLKYRV